MVCFSGMDSCGSWLTLQSCKIPSALYARHWEQSSLLSPVIFAAAAEASFFFLTAFILPILHTSHVSSTCGEVGVGQLTVNLV